MRSLKGTSLQEASTARLAVSYSEVCISLVCVAIVVWKGGKGGKSGGEGEGHRIDSLLALYYFEPNMGLSLLD